MAPVALELEVDSHHVPVVEHSVWINRPIATVAAALAAGPRKWLPRFDGPIHAVVGRQVAGPTHRKKVVVEIDQPLTAGDYAVVTITWEAKFIKRLGPVMTGTVELAPAEARITRLTVCGTYEPPLMSPGKQLDNSLLHGVATTTVIELAESIRERLVALTDR
jgi:hypothetical protein